MFLNQQRAVCFHPVRPVPHVPLGFCFRAKGQCRHIINFKSAFIMVHIRPKACLNNTFQSLCTRRLCLQRSAPNLWHSPPVLPYRAKTWLIFYWMSVFDLQLLFSLTTAWPTGHLFDWKPLTACDIVSWVGLVFWPTADLFSGLEIPPLFLQNILWKSCIFNHGISFIWSIALCHVVWNICETLT